MALPPPLSRFCATGCKNIVYLCFFNTPSFSIAYTLEIPFFLVSATRRRRAYSFRTTGNYVRRDRSRSPGESPVKRRVIERSCCRTEDLLATESGIRLTVQRYVLETIMGLLSRNSDVSRINFVNLSKIKGDITCLTSIMKVRQLP